MTAVFRTPSLPGRTIFTEEGVEYLYFGGTDYLGMGRNEDFLAHLHDGMRLGGTHFGSSRNNSLQLAFYEQAEAALAGYTAAPTSMIVSSGMWAGQLLMKTMPEILRLTGQEGNIQFHYAPRVHPALKTNDDTSVKTSWNEWALETVNIVMSSQDVPHVVCTDAVGSPWVEEFELSKLARADTEKLWLIVDDSHGLGVTGEAGSGCFSALKREIKKGHLIVVSSLNKALGVPGGAIMCDRPVLDLLRRSPWYAGASPPPPAYMHALTRMIETGAYKSAFSKLLENTNYFDLITGERLEFASIGGYPVYCSAEERLYNHLLAHRIMSSCFSYPAPADPPVTRLAINALHTKTDLDLLAEVCLKF